jgi:hypothetical protein
VQYVWFYFVGAVAAASAVYLIGGVGRGGATPVRLTPAGVALGISFTSRQAWMRRGEMRNQRDGVTGARGSKPVCASNRSPRSCGSASISRT